VYAYCAEWHVRRRFAAAPVHRIAHRRVNVSGPSITFGRNKQPIADGLGGFDIFSLLPGSRPRTLSPRVAPGVYFTNGGRECAPCVLTRYQFLFWRASKPHGAGGTPQVGQGLHDIRHTLTWRCSPALAKRQMPYINRASYCLATLFLGTPLFGAR
jgi:hypothetical protein